MYFGNLQNRTHASPRTEFGNPEIVTGLNGAAIDSLALL
jgi:hypothetical protein